MRIFAIREFLYSVCFFIGIYFCLLVCLVCYCLSVVCNRVIHHRSSISRKMQSYIHKHFALPDHDLSNLKVQPIDTAEDARDLHNLEKHWISSLSTLVPFGLNVSY